MKTEEIIKALEYCADASYCCNCAFDDEGESVSECTSKLAKAALDLIQRQQKEIEKLKNSRDRWRRLAKDFDEESREIEKEFERGGGNDR